MEQAHRYTAGGIVLGDNGTIALVCAEKGSGYWQFPKGHIEEGETPEEAARREILEEANISDLEFIDDLGEYARQRPAGRTGPDAYDLKHIHMFLFAAPSGSTIAPGMEIAEAKWVHLPQVLEHLSIPADKAWFTSVFERVRQAIQRD